MRNDAFGLLFLLALIGIGVVAIYGAVQFVRFWIGFARGINEAQGELRGFEVKLNTGETPVLREKETNHG